MSARRCGATINGPRQESTRSAVRWRKSCKAYPMRDPGDLVGFEEGRCFQHQPSEVRGEVYRRRAEAQAEWARTYRRIHGHWPGEKS